MFGLSDGEVIRSGKGELRAREREGDGEEFDRTSGFEVKFLVDWRLGCGGFVLAEGRV